MRPSRRMDIFAPSPPKSPSSEFLQSNLNTSQFFYPRCFIGTMLLGVSDALALRPSSSTRIPAPSSGTTTLQPVELAPTYISLVRALCDQCASRRLTHEQSNIQIPVSTFDESRDQTSPAHLAQGILTTHVSHPIFIFLPDTTLPYHFARTTLQLDFGGEGHDFGAVIPN